MKVLIQIAICALASLTVARSYANTRPLPQTFRFAQAAGAASTNGERIVVIDYDVNCIGENSGDFPRIQGNGFTK